MMCHRLCRLCLRNLCWRLRVFEFILFHFIFKYDSQTANKNNSCVNRLRVSRGNFGDDKNLEDYMGNVQILGRVVVNLTIYSFSFVRILYCMLIL